MHFPLVVVKILDWQDSGAVRATRRSPAGSRRRSSAGGIQKHTYQSKHALPGAWENDHAGSIACLEMSCSRLYETDSGEAPKSCSPDP